MWLYAGITTFEVLVEVAGKYAEFPRSREGGSLISESPALNKIGASPGAALVVVRWNDANFEVLVDAAGKYAEFPRSREGGSLISESPALNKIGASPGAALAVVRWDGVAEMVFHIYLQHQ
ncbi:MAG: hypothetical protein ING71_10610 [Rhodocyclaceae bacterium]|nr:hypothetical protein [Rhodocyclaceae bacterium]MCA3025132.1 hypothetical protein [Rhodocyclaceae bacterium]MCA3038592.1 hypothetical protein [Rhodocyclaceae bacterium]MCA3064023.1 hypothetical protein [Rhodocyclaceae bacterium]MCA3079229.1 hypothetical protein [Rhodocyclaceae bacterium]